MTAKTDTTPYKGHFGLYLTGLGVALLLFTIVAYLASSARVTGWEYAWFATVNNWSDGWYRPMAIVTLLGSGWMAIASVAGVFFARFYRLAGRSALSVLLAYGITAIIKHLIGRERPSGLFEDLHVRAIEFGMGFPSTHAAVATVIMLTFLPYMPGKWRWFVPIAILGVAVSRIYLGVHLPLDVVGGIAAGVAIVSFIRVLPQPLRVLLRID